MTISEHSVKGELEKWFSSAERVVIAGIGNPIRRDDFVGVKIVQELRERVSDRVYLIECETVPESFMQQIIDFDPTHILLIDAAILGLIAGDTRLVNPGELTAHPAFSTHALPLRIFCEYMGKATRAKIALLLIEPENTEFGEGLTAEVEASVQCIADALLKILPGASGNRQGK